MDCSRSFNIDNLSLKLFWNCSLWRSIIFLVELRKVFLRRCYWNFSFYLGRLTRDRSWTNNFLYNYLCFKCRCHTWVLWNWSCYSFEEIKLSRSMSCKWVIDFLISNCISHTVSNGWINKSLSLVSSILIKVSIFQINLSFLKIGKSLIQISLVWIVVVNSGVDLTSNILDLCSIACYSRLEILLLGVQQNLNESKNGFIWRSLWKTIHGRFN